MRPRFESNYGEILMKCNFENKILVEGSLETKMSYQHQLFAQGLGEMELEDSNGTLVAQTMNKLMPTILQVI